MAPRKNQLLSYATRLKALCPELPQAKVMARNLRSPATGFDDHRLNFPVLCTDGRGHAPPETCQILDELPAWNELLYFVNTEAREVHPGRLTLSTMCAISSGVPATLLEQAQVALLCLHWLLTEHRCVDLLEVDRFVLNTHPRILLDALQRSQCLVAVRLSSHSIEAGVLADLLAALANTCRLTDLQCSDIRISGDPEQKQAVTKGFIAAAGSLKALQLIRVKGLTGPDAIIEALRSDSNISKLAIDLPEKRSTADALAQFVSGSAVLADLTVVGYDRMVGPCRLDYLIEAMAASRSLENLCIEQYGFDVLEVTLLTNALVDSTTLRQVVFNSCSWGVSHKYDIQRDGPDRAVHCETCKGWWGQGWRVDPFVRAVSRSPSLQRLAFSSSPFKAEELRRLLVAVAEKSSFQTLSFQWLTQMSTEELLAMLASTGTVGKVAVAWCRLRPMFTNDWLYMPRESTDNGEHMFFDLNPLRLRQVCATLATNYMITALCLHGSLTGAPDDDREPAVSLASFVATTMSLKELRVSVRTSEQNMCVILSGICRNASLEKLSIEGWHLSGSDVRDFCKWIRQSRHLCHLVLLRGRAKANAALVSGLAECADDIYTLTFFCTWEMGADPAQLQVIKNMIRRNGSLVQRAAQFALGSSMARCASAFELVSWHPAVQSAVQELAAVDGEGARRMLEESKRRLSRDFWRLAGIFREDLCCHERADGKLQIDQLGVDCLLLVRRFLRVGDVAGNGGQQTCKVPSRQASTRVLRKRKATR